MCDAVTKVAPTIKSSASPVVIDIRRSSSSRKPAPPESHLIKHDRGSSEMSENHAGSNGDPRSAKRRKVTSPVSDRTSTSSRPTEGLVASSEVKFDDFPGSVDQVRNNSYYFLPDTILIMMQHHSSNVKPSPRRNNHLLHLAI